MNGGVDAVVERPIGLNRDITAMIHTLWNEYPKEFDFVIENAGCEIVSKEE